MENTHEMRQKIEQHDAEPHNDFQAYIPCSEIHEEDKDEETKHKIRCNFCDKTYIVISEPRRHTSHRHPLSVGVEWLVE